MKKEFKKKLEDIYYKVTKKKSVTEEWNSFHWVWLKIVYFNKFMLNFIDYEIKLNLEI